MSSYSHVFHAYSAYTCHTVMKHQHFQNFSHEIAPEFINQIFFIVIQVRKITFQVFVNISY